MSPKAFTIFVDILRAIGLVMQYFCQAVLGLCAKQSQYAPLTSDVLQTANVCITRFRFEIWLGTETDLIGKPGLAYEEKSTDTEFDCCGS